MAPGIRCGPPLRRGRPVRELQASLPPAPPAAHAAVLRVRLRPSRQLGWLLGAGHAAALVLSWVAPVAWWLSLTLSLAVVTSLAFSLRYHALRSAPRRIDRPRAEARRIGCGRGPARPLERGPHSGVELRLTGPHHPQSGRGGGAAAALAGQSRRTPCRPTSSGACASGCAGDARRPISARPITTRIPELSSGRLVCALVGGFRGSGPGRLRVYFGRSARQVVARFFMLLPPDPPEPHERP